MEFAWKLAKGQGDQVSGNFQAGPKKSILARKPGIIFQSPEFSKISLNFENLCPIWRFSTKLWLNEGQI